MNPNFLKFVYLLPIPSILVKIEPGRASFKSLQICFLDRQRSLDSSYLEDQVLLED